MDKAFGTVKTTFDKIGSDIGYSMYSMGNAMKGFFMPWTDNSTLSKEDWEKELARGKDPLKLTDREKELLLEDRKKEEEARAKVEALRSKIEEEAGVTLPSSKPFSLKEISLLDELKEEE